MKLKQKKMGNKKSSLNAAKEAKNDEFYTQLSDIENELKHYKKHFEGKTILCNCDDPIESNFFVYFRNNFDRFGLKKLITICYKNNNPDLFSQNDSDKAVSVEYNGINNKTISYLNGNGDFRNKESIELLKKADIVITNPPFSLFREYITQLFRYDKKFLIIGSNNAAAYKEIFPYIIENKLWIGYTVPKNYLQPNGSEKSVLTWWYTNLTINKREEELILFKKYTPEDYPKYDYYDAININAVNDIPCDYYGKMGVPGTFLKSYNPDQFEIVDGLNRHNILNGPTSETKGKFQTQVNGVAKFIRIIIKRK